MKESTNDWLTLARDDLALIEAIKEREDLSHLIAFHAQQALEKTFKAILEEYGDVPRIHQVSKLYEKAKVHIALDVSITVLHSLDQLYTETRYPGVLGLLPDGKPPLKSAMLFYQTAKETLDSSMYLLQ